ncbi:RraA family protein [Jannaschia seohaensis]|uniref:Putative 4-hydroxy-4-methyl-2-oxoglutarate aldolase n=1 Tax=Jannaschia seohaensis TaxID=475081 RepID=A0A2Y9B7K6_9RHOB|nr:aldolase [Jannaschia seohaensis]PWJ10907.1 4-hydroxy-4-methyl-2-oxoglutarate aldolase [Jannaschia seohaensis]SSA51508.1 4-hydroxy-4-methyl-2-oxoglutarate aldolase [Jannaschia seohaensis]
MIEEPKRLRIARSPRRPTEAHIAAFAGIPTGFVVDAMWGSGAMDASIAPLPGLPDRVHGPAMTAGNRPGDLLATLGAIHLAQPGDVIVAEAQGYMGCAAAGDRVMGILKNRGGVGLVTDGPMRDLDGLQSVGLPVWCRGLTPNSPVARGPGTVGLPVIVGGIPVEAGDMIVADRDGVVVVPFARIDETIAALARVAEAERALDAEVAEGRDQVGLIGEMLERGDEVEWV